MLQIIIELAQRFAVRTRADIQSHDKSDERDGAAGVDVVVSRPGTAVQPMPDAVELQNAQRADQQIGKRAGIVCHEGKSSAWR